MFNKYRYVDLSRIDFLTGNVTLQNTANCYVIKKSGKYCFPIVYGNAIKDGKYNTAAYELFFRVIDCRQNRIKSPFILDGVSYKELSVKVLWNYGLELSKIKFNFKNTQIKFKAKVVNELGGNATIGLYIDGEFYWTWHIWYFPHKLSLVPIKYKRKKRIPDKYNDYLLPVPLGFCGDFNKSVVDKVCYYDLDMSISFLDEYLTKYPPFIRGGYWFYKERIKTILDPCPAGFKIPYSFTMSELIKNSKSIMYIHSKKPCIKLVFNEEQHLLLESSTIGSRNDCFDFYCNTGRFIVYRDLVDSNNRTIHYAPFFNRPQHNYKCYCQILPCLDLGRKR